MSRVESGTSAGHAKSLYVRPLRHAASIRRSVAAILGCLAIVGATTCGAETPDASDNEIDSSRDDPSVEEVWVTGERVTKLTPSERREIYRQLAKGRRLYSESQYKRALPLLLNPAQHGFKDAQARVGYIYLKGLGEVAQDSRAAVGWFGVAATGNTSPDIENYFNDIWRRIPVQDVPYFREVVEEYKSKYGENATGVKCDLHRVSSLVKRLACYFAMDQRTLDRLSHDATRRSIALGLEGRLGNPPDRDPDPE